MKEKDIVFICTQEKLQVEEEENRRKEGDSCPATL